jgi:hypothetical protein
MVRMTYKFDLGRIKSRIFLPRGTVEKIRPFDRYGPVLVILRAIQHRGNDQMHGPDHGDPKVAVRRH